MKRWNMIHKIKLLYDDGNGYSIRAIANELQVSRNTIRRYLQMNEEEISRYLKNRERTKELDKYKEYIISLLEKYEKLSAVKIKRKLKAKGIVLTVSNRSVRRYVNRIKQNIAVKQKRYYEPVIDMVPGVQCQVDPGEIRNVPVGDKFITVYFVVFVLSFSRQMYVAASKRPINTEMFIRMHDEAFRYFDGVCEECVYDQTRLVAIREEFREVWFNERFYQYASAARFDIRVCEGYDPESKGKVESGVKYVKNDFFYGDTFDSFDQLKTDLFSWANTVANNRIHGTTKKRPEEVYSLIEQSKMKPYLQPGMMFDVNGQKRNVDKTSLISYKSNKYSVPMIYQSSTVMIRQDSTKLMIYNPESSDMIAEHDICEGKGHIIKNTNHYRDHRKRIKDLEEDIAEIVGNELGQKLCTILKASSPKIYRDQFTGLIKVIKQHSDKQDIDNPLGLLAERPRLTVTFIRDYLEAFYSNREYMSFSWPDNQERRSDALSRYSIVSISGSHNKEVAAHEHI